MDKRKQQGSAYLKISDPVIGLGLSGSKSGKVKRSYNNQKYKFNLNKKE